MWPLAIPIAVALTIGSVVGFALAILAMMARNRDEIAMLNWKPDKIARAARATERPSNQAICEGDDMAPSNRICSIPDCERPHMARGWCRLHYYRWRRQGDPLANLRPDVVRAPASERFWSGVDRRGPDECWPWLRSGVGGYGRFHADGKKVRVHRYSYELAYGPIPDNMPLDHTCHTRAVQDGLCEGGVSCPHRRCVNPRHIEIVSPLVNVMRGSGPPALNAQKTHCPQGHAYDLINTSFSNGARNCRPCRAKAERDRRKRGTSR